MGKVGNAVMGVAMSTGVLVGAYGIGELEAKQERDRIDHCADLFEGQALEDCIDDTKFDYEIVPDILALAGVSGIIGCGYLGYKALKEEIGTTGIVDDHL